YPSPTLEYLHNPALVETGGASPRHRQRLYPDPAASTRYRPGQLFRLRQHCLLKPGDVRRHVIQVVHGYPEHVTTGGAEQQLPGLRQHFHLFERRLLLGIAAIRRIPVTVIILLAPRLPGHAPVRHFMQRRTEIVMAIMDFGGVSAAGGTVERLVLAAHQYRVELLAKTAAEQCVQQASLIRLLTGQV